MIEDTKVLSSTYKALNEGYNYIIQQGGTWSGKTFSVLVAVALYLQELKTKVKPSYVVGQSSTEINSGSYEDWQVIMEELKCGRCLSKVSKKWKIGHNEISFKSVDTEGKAKSGKSHLVFFNEANHLPYEVYRQIALRSDIKIIDFNPSSKFWLHKKVLPQIGQYKHLIKRTTYLDNPTLSKEKITEIESLASDPYMRDVYMLGILPKLEGVVFEHKEYSQDLHLAAYQNHGYFLDFGFTNDVTSLGEAALIGGEIYCKELIYKTGLLTKDINDLMVKLGVSKSKPIYCDNIPKEVAELATYGWTLIKTKKYNGSVNDTINLIKPYPINVHYQSLNAINEFENYQYIKKDGEFINTPIDKFNHFCDGLRYWGQFNLSSVIRSNRASVSVTNVI